jgi:hypothetical protein
MSARHAVDTTDPAQAGLVRSAIVLVLSAPSGFAWPPGLRPVVLDGAGRPMSHRDMQRWLACNPLDENHSAPPRRCPMSNGARRVRRGNAPRRPILWYGDSPGGNYMEKIFSALRRGEIPLAAGTVAHLHIQHDDDCPILRPRPGICRCNADVSTITEEEAIELDVREAQRRRRVGAA